MKPILIVPLMASFLVVSGCGKKEAETSIPSRGSTAEVPPADPAAEAPTASAPVTATLSSVDSSIKSGAVDQAAASLLAVRNSGRQMTVDQSLQVNDRMRQLQVRIAEMMASGDPRAKQAAQLLQASQPR